MQAGNRRHQEPSGEIGRQSCQQNRQERAKGSKGRAACPAPKFGGQDQDRAQVQVQGARVQAQGAKAEAQGTRTQSLSASAFSAGKLV